MNIGFLGLNNPKKSKVFKYFKVAAKQLGITIDYYNPSDFIIEVANDTVKVLDYNMQHIPLDGIINWLPDAKYFYELYEAFTYSNIPCINNASSSRNAKNKLLTNIILSKHQLPQPKTLFMHKLLDIPRLSLNPPIVYKKKCGCKGKGSFKFDSMHKTKEFLEDKLGYTDIYLQEYIKNNGWDMRIIIVGNKAIGGIKKTAKKDEWRTHVAHGGRAEPCELDESVISMCLEANKALDLAFSGIDVIQDINGDYFILEVNHRPGLAIFYETTGINIAYEILKYFRQEVLQD